MSFERLKYTPNIYAQYTLNDLSSSAHRIEALEAAILNFFEVKERFMQYMGRSYHEWAVPNNI